MGYANDTRRLAELEKTLRKRKMKVTHTDGGYILWQRKRIDGKLQWVQDSRWHDLHDLLFEFGLVGEPRIVNIEDLPEIALFLSGGERSIYYGSPN